jgi:hypothetical protein
MDEGTATVIASVVAATGSVAVAWITTRRPPAPPAASAMPARPDDLRVYGQGDATQPMAMASPPPPPPGGPQHIVARSLLWFLYFLTGVLLVICGSENDIDQQTANFAAGFAILTGIAAYLVRRRIRTLHRA